MNGRCNWCLLRAVCISQLLRTPFLGAGSLGFKFLCTCKYSERIYPVILKAVVSAEERSSKNKSEWKKKRSPKSNL